MQQRYIQFILFVFCVCATHCLLAQASFSASVSSNIIGKEESFQLKLMIENARHPEQVSPPPLTNFIILSGPVQESGSEEINGELRTYAGISYVLRPKKTGSFVIPSASAKADGKNFKSNPVAITVVSGATGNNAAGPVSPFGGFGFFDEQPERATNYNDFILRKGETVQDKVSKNLFIRVLTDKKSCYVGEPVVATYKLYTRLKSESSISKNPSLNGFSVIDLVQPQSGINYAVENFEGRDYNVYIIRRPQLYPLQPGAAELEPAAVDNALHFVKEEYLRKMPDGSYEFLPGVTSKEAAFDENVTVESRPDTITVKPLPAEGKPASFNGAVGNFSIDAFAEKENITTDDAGKLRILLSGQGNMTLVPSPEVQWPKGIEGYEPVVKDGLNRLTVPVRGSRAFEFSFTAEKPGDYTIPAISFSFFDPQRARYEVISTKPITVHIKKGTGKKPVVAETGKGVRESFFEKIFTNRWMIILPVALLIITGLILWVRADKKKQQEKQRSREALLQQEESIVEEEVSPLPFNPLCQSEALLLHNDAKHFYDMLGKELHVFLAQKLQLAPEAVSKKTIADGLDKLGVSIADSFAMQQLLDDIALQLYTPFADETKMQNVFVEAMRLIDAVKNA